MAKTVRLIDCMTVQCFFFFCYFLWFISVLCSVLRSCIPAFQLAQPSTSMTQTHVFGKINSHRILYQCNAPAFGVIFPHKNTHSTVTQELTVMVTTTSTGDTGDLNSSSSPSSSSGTGTDSVTNPLTESSPSTLLAAILGAVGALIAVLNIVTVVILVIITLRKRREKAGKPQQEIHWR